MEGVIPNVKLNSGKFMPTIGVGTASDPPASAEVFRAAMIEAITIGYRHFDTAAMYGTEQPLGEAVAAAIQSGLIKSREELFITSKIWPTDTLHDRVIPALQLSLKMSRTAIVEPDCSPYESIIFYLWSILSRNLLIIMLHLHLITMIFLFELYLNPRLIESRRLQLEYIDLYLIHWPISLKTKEAKFPIDTEDIIPLDMKSVWEALEECQQLGLVKSIGVSNFSCKKLEHLLSTARIVPSVNQVEMHPVWQQKKLISFCKEKGIRVVAYSPLGAKGTTWGANQVMECDVLKEIALARGKSIAQVSLRWIYEQGASLVIKSFQKERMNANIEIFDWELSEEESHKISLIPQSKIITGDLFLSPTGPYKTLDELWDGEI